MNRGGSAIYTGTLTNVGTSYVGVTINTPTPPPRQGYLCRIKVSIAGGPGTKVRARVRELPTTRVVCEYDDPDVPGDPIEAPLHFADTELWYDRGAMSFVVDVATDDVTALTVVSVEVEIRHAR